MSVRFSPDEQSSWHTAPGRLYRYTKGESSVPATMLQREDKSFTADFAEMDDLLRKAWSPIFALYHDSPEPAWEPFAERFGRYIRRVPMVLEDIKAADLQRTLAKQSTRFAAGMEGWRVADLTLPAVQAGSADEPGGEDRMLASIP